MFANGSGTRAEVGSGKAVYGSLKVSLSDDFFFEAYADYSDRGDGIDRTTLQGFVGYGLDDTRIGAQFARQSVRGAGRADVDRHVASLYVVRRVASKADVLVRLDRMFDPNPPGAGIDYLPFDPTARSLFLLAGIDLEVGPAIHLIPNLEWIGYDAVDDGPDPDADLMLRATFVWSW